jgi:ABC-type microcin C transport system permease subunit YejB
VEQKALLGLFQAELFVSISTPLLDLLLTYLIDITHTLNRMRITEEQ